MKIFELNSPVCFSQKQIQDRKSTFCKLASNLYLMIIVLCSTLFSAQAIAQAPDIVMNRDNSAIAWSSGNALNAEYKDVQTARDPDGSLMLYLPLTRASSGQQFDTIYIWNDVTNEFEDQTASLLPFLDPFMDRGTYDVDFVDIDRDGDHDIVHSSPHFNRIYVNRRNEALAAFSDETNSRLPEFMRLDVANVFDDVTAGDVDGDGDLDLMFSNRNFSVHPDSEANWGPNVLVYNDGSGHFGLTEETRELYGDPTILSDGTLKLQGSSHGSKFADFNNDGRLDLIISHLSNYTFGNNNPAPDYEIMMNQGDTDADGKVNWVTTEITQDGKIINVGVFDYDNDGNIDLYLARGGNNDQILTGLGDGTFSAPLNITGLLNDPSLNGMSYDVAFGDFNDDGLMDIIVADADSSDRINHLYINDLNNPNSAAPRLFASNEDDFNPDTGNPPLSTLSAQPVDYDNDGDLDVIMGADARGIPPGVDKTPLIIRNDSGLSDTLSPTLEHPSMTLAANQNPSAMFRVRVRDRVIDFDEINADLTWSTTGVSGGTANGNIPLLWGAQMTYQSLISCNEMRGGSFDETEAISSISWSVDAHDSVPTNTATISSTNPGAPDLLSQLHNSVASSGIGINILEPLGSGSAPVVRDDGTDRLLIRVALTPANLIPNLNEFTVRINGNIANNISVNKVGDQVWLAVEPPSGPAGVHDLQVSYGICGLTGVSDTETNAVAYDDNPDDVDSVLVIDLSGSMNSNNKLEAAINAGKLYINTLRDQDKIGIVQYSGSSASGATTAFNLAPVSSGRPSAITALDGLSASGCTPLGAGLEQGLTELENLAGNPANPSRNMLLLSDGRENITPFWDIEPSYKCSAAPNAPTVAPQFALINSDANPANDVRVDTVALGPNADLGLMSLIANATGGESRQVLETAGTIVASLDTKPNNKTLLDVTSLFVTSAHAQTSPVRQSQPSPMSASLVNNLADLYENYHNGVSGQDRIFRALDNNSPQKFKSSEIKQLAGQAGEIIGDLPVVDGQFTGRIIDLIVPENLSYATLSVNWEKPTKLTAAVIPPTRTGEGAVEISRASTNAVVRIRKPTPGIWRIALGTDENFEVLSLVSGKSSVSTFARALIPNQPADLGNTRINRPAILKPGAQIPIAMMLTGTADLTGASVIARATSPGNGVETIRLMDDGKGLDTQANDGVYTGVISKTNLGGSITVDVTSRWGDGNSSQTRVTPLSIEMVEKDSDGDSISDVIELALGLNPKNPRDAFDDWDNDGLVNWREIIHSLDLNNPDTDGGGLSDGKEIAIQSDPENNKDDDEAEKDTDKDGLPDLWETAYGLDPDNADDAKLDLDKDGLNNLEEFKNGTSPINVDSDSDGKRDGDEIKAGSDPTDSHNRADQVKVTDRVATRTGPRENNMLGTLKLICILLLLVIIALLSWIIFRQKRINS